MSGGMIQQRSSHDEIYMQLQSLLSDEVHPVANMANMAALLYHSLRDMNWVGFYLRYADELVLGPFQGKAACVRIPVGKGVCGSAVEKQQTMIVDDVNQFQGHIACDADSRSEIVVPLYLNNQIIGVLDADSPVINRFQAEEKEFFEQCSSLLVASSSGWENYHLLS